MTKKLLFGLKRHTLLQGCIFFSLLIHAAMIGFIQQRSFSVHSHKKPSWQATGYSALETESKKGKGAILKEFFHKEFSLPTLASSLTPAEENEKESFFSSRVLEQASSSEEVPNFFFSTNKMLPHEHLLILQEILPWKAPLSISFESHENLLQGINYPGTETELPASSPTLFSKEAAETLSLSKTLLAIENDRHSASLFLQKETGLDASKHLLLEKFSSLPELPSDSAEEPTLVHMPSLHELSTSSVGESFDVDLMFLPKKQGDEEYVFALTLIPKREANFPKLKQNFYFMIDKSNAIQKSRLKATLSAIYKSLSFLPKEDAFNLIAYDSKFERMSIENQPVSKEARLQAKNFLSHLHLGSFFSSSDPYKPLNALLFEKNNPEELSTVILISNGEGLANQNKQSYFLHNWTMENEGRIALFSLGISDDKNSHLLDALSSLNKGRFHASPTMHGLKRKLSKLVKSIRFPIMKDVACTIISRSPKSDIKIYPTFQQMPALYADQPLVLMGTTKSLDDFILFIQGKQKNAWLNIKKNISFLHAKQGSNTLEVQWALQKSYHLYERYFRDGNPQHLFNANTLLKEHELPSIF